MYSLHPNLSILLSIHFDLSQDLKNYIHIYLRRQDSKVTLYLVKSRYLNWSIHITFFYIYLYIIVVLTALGPLAWGKGWIQQFTKMLKLLMKVTFRMSKFE